MALVTTESRKTTIEGRFNKFQFDTLMAEKRYPFLVVCSTELTDRYIEYCPEYYCFHLDMDFFYKANANFEYFTQYLVVPDIGFSLENFIKWCADYCDPSYNSHNT